MNMAYDSVVFDVGKDLDPEYLDLLEQLALAEARECFPAFRRYMRPEMKWGWWCEDVSWEFQQFYEDLIAGKRPSLALMAPPQHGKSWTALDFLAWFAGKHPELRSIFASYSDELGVRTNLDLQRLMQTERYKKVFDTRIGLPGWQCNTNYIEYCNDVGSFRNTTVNGSINGLGLHLGVIDDPVKSRKEAQSKLVRDGTWNWYADDFYGRFDERAGQLILMTRWHVDDLLGRALERMKGQFKILRYPAIAEEDGVYRKKGEALFPQWKSKDFLLKRKGLQSQASWQSLYQQSPIIVGGGQLPIENLKVLNSFDRSMISATCRYWDKAGTDSENAAATAGCLMHRLQDGRIVIGHMAWGQWSALERERHIKSVSMADAATYSNYRVVVEQEPGSGGKESAEATIRMLAGLIVTADKVSGSKEVRAEPFVAQVQGSNVYLLAGEWVVGYLDEAEVWPSGKRMDRIDASSGAFNTLMGAAGYDSSYSGFQ